jgi:hypothetical protein
VTTEQRHFEPQLEQCVLCGVKQYPKELNPTFDEDMKCTGYVCRDQARCLEWKRQREAELKR